MVRLTKYSHGAGCGCKISPAVLQEIVGDHVAITDSRLLVGNDKKDDAAVYDLGNGTAIISTTDFFMPIVDDPMDFGQIAAANAISDVYAMGGTPIMAIAILGWPIKELDAKTAAKVIEGGRMACRNAGIELAGGHSIDSPEPIFGLAVTGTVAVDRLKTNAGARVGDLLYLTKPLGVGILSTAQKKEKLDEAHQTLARDWMIQLNSFGMELAQHDFVHALTDVTGFGLLGHLLEMCLASGISARIHFDEVPLIDQSALIKYISLDCFPGGSQRNWDSYGLHVTLKTMDQQLLLCDPQTSGGLLLAVEPEHQDAFEEIALSKLGRRLRPIGLIEEGLPHIIVE